MTGSTGDLRSLLQVLDYLQGTQLILRSNDTRSEPWTFHNTAVVVVMVTPGLMLLGTIPWGV